MNKKIIVIGIIGMFLLTSITAMSAVQEESASEAPSVIHFMNPMMPNGEDYLYSLYTGETIPMAPLPIGDTIQPKWVSHWVRDEEEFPEEWDVYGNQARSDGIAIDEENGYVYLSGSSHGAYEKNGECCFFFNDAVLLKYDLDGDLQWHKILGAKADHWIGSCQVCEYNGYVYVSHTNADCNIVLSKFDSSGNEVWTQVWPGGDDNIPMGITEDNGFIYITGLTVDDGTYCDLFLLKYDTNGNEQWTLTWNNNDYNGNDIGLGVTTDSNGYVYVTGKTEKTYGDDYGDVLLVKFDSNGIFQWKKIWNGDTRDLAISIAFHDEYLYVTGVTAVYRESDTVKVFLLKYDLEGNQVWSEANSWPLWHCPRYWDDICSIFIKIQVKRRFCIC